MMMGRWWVACRVSRFYAGRNVRKGRTSPFIALPRRTAIGANTAPGFRGSERPVSTHRRPWMGRRCTQIRPFKRLRFFGPEKISMIYGYARISTDGQSVAAQVTALRKHGAGKVFREVASGAKTHRPQLRRLLAEIRPGDVLTVTRLDRLARSTRDLLNTLAAITGKKPVSARLARCMGRHHDIARPLMLTVLAGLAEFERDLNPRAHRRRTRTRQRARRQTRP
jgi:hypothetical protein